MFLIVDFKGSFTFNLYQALAKIHPHIEVVDYRHLDSNAIEKMKAMAVILSSGPKLPKDYPEAVQFVKTFYSRLPILGISLGHLILAEAFGAKIMHVKTIEHGKASHIKHTQDALFDTLPDPFLGGFFHTFVISKDGFPNELKVIAETEDGTIMGIKQPNFPCYGVQFYPDTILTPQGDLLLKNFVHIAQTWTAGLVA